jgi:pimeloyl-ACP methyl ester carboxylesterase
VSTWILLRGLTREARHWGSFPDLLRDAFPHAPVIALDLPGNGEFNAATSPLSAAEMASHCRKLIARQDLQPPYRLLAMSMGAMVATAWAEQAPAEIEACVLVNTSFAAFNPLHERLRPRAWPTLLQLLFARNVRHREQLVFSLTSRLERAPPPLLDDWVAILRSRPVRAGNALRQLIAAARFRAPSHAPVSTLVLTGAGDSLVNARCSKEIARRWNCAIAMHPTAGHDLPLDEGEWVAREVREWLGALPVRR